MAQWCLESLEISGGFLADLSLRLPQGLVCIIGPRGSGKSTLAEAIRLALGGMPTGANKSRLEFIKANLGGAVLTVTTAPGTDRGGYTIRRTYGQPAILATTDGRPVTTVDLDRGTFLPLDAYSSLEIEAIADESLGPKRRALLDDLCPAEMQQIQLSLSDQQRVLEANAAAIQAVRRRVADVTEQIEELGDAPARLEALPRAAAHGISPEFQAAARQHQFNEREREAFRQRSAALAEFRSVLEDALLHLRQRLAAPPAVPESANAALLVRADQAAAALCRDVEETLGRAGQAVALAEAELENTGEALRNAHAGQEERYLALQQQNQAAAQAVEARTSAERAVAALEALTEQRSQADRELRRLQDQRKDLKAEYLLTRDRIAEQREAVAARLQQEAGRKVRVRVQRNADTLEYQQTLLEALRGSKLRNQDEILSTLTRIRPEHLAQILSEDDLAELEAQASFGPERGRKILDALRRDIDPLGLEMLPVEDRITIELNVAATGQSNYKDAAELSRGQKCTALLPILLARRESPLVVDQPEDNLDNHFIYETVVETIRRLKPRRQMLFITHNANIPVLGEAELVVVMDSDGRRGYVKKAGSVDECRRDIIDLLEGGEEAFELRRRRYGS